METFSWYPRMLILDVVDQIDLYYLHRYVPHTVLLYTTVFLHQGLSFQS